MNPSTTQHGSDDAALRELERALDAFMAAHVSTAAHSLATRTGGDDDDVELNKMFVDEDDGDEIDGDQVSTSISTLEIANFQRDLKRLQCLSSVLTATRQRRGPASIVSMGNLLLSWLQIVESSSAAAAAVVASSGILSPPSAAEAARAAEHAQQQSPVDSVASYLVAMLLKIAFQVPQPSSNADPSSDERVAINEVIASVMAQCFVVFQRAWQAEEEAQRRSRAESSGTLFSYLTMRKAKPKRQSSSSPLSAAAIYFACATEAATAWSHVLGLAASLAPDVSRMKLQIEALTRAPAWNATKTSGDIGQHPYLKYLAHIRLGLAPRKHQPSSALAIRMSEATQWLRVLMPLLLKPHQSHVRSAIAYLVSHLLLQELYSLGRLELSVIYTSTSSEWSRCVSDLHSAALRLTDSAKKKSRGRAQQQFEASAWTLRTVVLALAPSEIFTRYWREDALALLRLQYHLNQDASANGATSYNVLSSLELSFTYMMHRHFVLRDSGALAAGAPSDSDCMEIINTTQAWSFFSLPRLRPQTLNSSSMSSFVSLKTIALPALVHISRAIAAYNMTYTVQSHLRRLLAEPVGVGDPQKLVGLEALVDLLCRSQSEHERDNKRGLTFQVNQNDLLACKQMIGELVGRVLLECSTRIGHKLLLEVPVTMNKKGKAPDDGDDDDDEHWKDPTNAVVVATFAAALTLMPTLYAHVALSNEQKLLLLVRASVNAERVVHRRAHEALLALIGPQSPHSTESPPPDAGAVVRALTDYIMRMHVSSTTVVSDAAGAIIIVRLLGVLLDPSRAAVTRWDSVRARVEALIQVEAIAVYLLARGDDSIEAEQLLRLAALETLRVAHEVRVTYREQPAIRSSTQATLLDRSSVDVLLQDLEPELQTAFFTFGPNAAAPLLDDCPDKHSALRRLIFDTSERHSFRWSLCLARIVTSLTKQAPDVTAYIWTDIVDKVAKLEPVLSVTSVNGDSPLQSQRELARWRNLALLTTVSACPLLQTQIRETKASSFCSDNTSSCPSESPSVAPSVMVASLVRQLACYLRSTNTGQCNSAVLALGYAGPAALSTLLDVLARLEVEAFASTPRSGDQDSVDGNGPGQTQRTRSVRTGKVPKKKLLELQHARTVQFALQWAIGRCYRLQLEPRTRTLNGGKDSELGGPMTERLIRAVSAFLVKMTATFEDVAWCFSDNSEASEGSLTVNPMTQTLDENAVLLMVQLDFMALSRALILHSNAAAKPEVQLPQEKLARLLLGWCGSFDKDLAEPSLAGRLCAGFVAPEADHGLYSHWMQLCDVTAARDGTITFPWIWIENQHQLLGTSGSASKASRSVAKYIVCQRAFSTLVELLRSSLQLPHTIGTWDGDSVVAWLDACFSVDSTTLSHFGDLHQLAQRALHVLLETPCASVRFYQTLKCCLEKATCSFASTAKSKLQAAHQYLEALGSSGQVMTFFHSLLHRLQEQHSRVHDKEEVGLAVRLLHVLLLHVGVQLDNSSAHRHRQVALDMVATLVCKSEASDDDDESAATCWGLQSYYSPSLETHIAGRLQVSVSGLLASRFSALSLRVSLAILRSMPTTSAQNRDNILQQRQMLATVLPWLAEVSLSRPQESSIRPMELLELLFNLTTVLEDSCGEQLDHIWLTLAFARHGDDDRNLREIIGFLFQQQRKSLLPACTAKIVMRWLCRWQDAASDVLRLLLLQLPFTTTRESYCDDVVTALDDLDALVALASDSSCHLVQTLASPCSLETRALVVHLMHIALATLFALLESNVADESAFSAIAQHCHVLLHSVFPLLEAPRGLLAAALASIRSSTLTIKTDDKNTQSLQRKGFLDALHTLGVCLTVSERQIWSELCVQEIALAISLDGTLTTESLELPQRPSPPHQVCVRFALAAYTHLSPRFQGDVLFSVLTLLRQALNAGVEDGRPSGTLSLARDCLALLAMLMQSMPVSRLALYPQVFWVSLALLTHCRRQHGNLPDSSPSLHGRALELLSIFWDRAPFTSHPVTQDIIRCTRPREWDVTIARNSVLMELVRCMYADEAPEGRKRAMEMMRKAVLLVPQDLLGVSHYEHLVICTLALLPALIHTSTIQDDAKSDAATDECTWDDLVVLWQTTDTGSSYDDIISLLQTRARIQTEQSSSRKLAAKLMAVFVPAVCALEVKGKRIDADFDGVMLSLEVLVACLPHPRAQSGDSPMEFTSTLNTKRCDFVFLMLEELLRGVLKRNETIKRAWRPVPELEAALARLLRSPRSEWQWRSAVRALSWITEIAKTAAGPTKSSVTRLPPHASDCEDDAPHGTPVAQLISHTRSTAHAKTLEEATSSGKCLLRRTSSRARISGTLSKKSSHEDPSNNNESSRSPELSWTKTQRLPEQPASTRDVTDGR